MDDEIQPPPLLLDFGEDSIEAGGVGHIAMAGEHGAKLGGQRLDALFQRIALPGQSKLCPMAGGGFGDAPGDGAVIGDTEDQPPFARHQAFRIAHTNPASKRAAV
jgi:hypothetical protein